MKRYTIPLGLGMAPSMWDINQSLVFTMSINLATMGILACWSGSHATRAAACSDDRHYPGSRIGRADRAVRGLPGDAGLRQHGSRDAAVRLAIFQAAARAEAAPASRATGCIDRYAILIVRGERPAQAAERGARGIWCLCRRERTRCAGGQAVVRRHAGCDVRRPGRPTPTRRGRSRRASARSISPARAAPAPAAPRLR